MRIRAAAVVALLLMPAAIRADEPPSNPLAGAGLLIAQQPKVARKRIEEALETYRRANDARQVAACYLYLAFADMNLQRQSDASAELDESIKRFEALGDHMAAWLVTVARGQFEEQQLHLDRSLVQYERALDIIAKASPPAEHFSMDGIASFASLFGFQSMPIPPEMMSSNVMKPFFLMFADTITRDGYGAALTESGELEKAEEQLNKARTSAALFGGLFDSSLAAHIGDLRRRQWRFAEARESYRRALDGVGVLPPFAREGDAIELGILEKLADIELLSGQTGAALAWNDRALAAVRKSNDRRRESRALQERGKLLFRAGRFDTAASVLDEALGIANDLHDPAIQGDILCDLGLLEMMRGRYGTATVHYEKAIEQFKKINAVDTQSYAWSMLAEVYFATGALDSARFALDNAMQLAHASGSDLSAQLVEMLDAGFRYALGRTTKSELDKAVAPLAKRPEAADIIVRGGMLGFINAAVDPGAPLQPESLVGEPLVRVMSTFGLMRGRALAEGGKFAEARSAWQEALEQNPSRELRAGLLALIGASWAREGNEEQATRYFVGAADTLETTLSDIHVEELLSQYLGYHNVYFEILLETLARQGRFEEAFNVAERARSRAFLQLVGHGRIDAGRGADADLVREAEALRVQIGEWERRASLLPDRDRRATSQDLQQARLRYESLMTQIKTSGSEYASIVSVRPFTVDQIRAALPADTTLVSYFVTPWHLHAWILDRTTFQHIELPVDRSAISRAVCWAERLDGQGRGVTVPNETCGDAATAEEVEQMLFAPLRGKVANRRLLIVPHGPLHYIPFAALRDPATGRYLIEDFTIVYAPSASSLPFLRDKETPVQGTALVLGDPFGVDGSDLPNALWEAARVADSLGTKALLGSDATESRLYHLDGKVDVIHIAAHGTYDADHPLYSRIALAPGDGRDGNLEVHEIMNELDLTGVNLVVLSACETARGKRSEGDDVVGLTRALLYAGTPGVISTLWRVRDDASAALMEEFYCRLRAGDSAADALRIAQITLLRSGRFADPGAWAAFALSGDPLGRWPADRAITSAAAMH